MSAVVTQHVHQPLWADSDMRKGEPVLLVPDGPEGRLQADLLFFPKAIHRVTATDERDVLMSPTTGSSRTIEFSSSEGLPFLTATELFSNDSNGCAFNGHADGRRYLHFRPKDYFQKRQLLVDYESEERWAGPIPEHQAGRLVGFTQRWRESAPIHLGLVGDSISVGEDASSVSKVPPYQPGFGELVFTRLSGIHSGSVRYRNFSIGGMTAAWGLEQAEEIGKADLDLVMIAFGMNDASELHSVEEFAANIKGLITGIRQHSDAEILLISGMSPNPDWYLAEVDRREQFHRILQDFSCEHVGFCDVASTWKFIVEKKGFWSVTGNGLNHPNDFGHRVYADCVCQSLVG